MRQKFVWTAMAMVAGAAIYTGAGAGRSPLFLWGYGTAYFLFGVVLLGAVARWWTRGSPALWRPFMLSVGSLGAALEIVLRNGQLAGLPPVDRWMVALVGLVAAAIAARLVPFRLTRFWLGIDRRGHEPGA
jgi:hypothetical protein